MKSMTSRRKGMSPEQITFLNLRHFPAVLNALQTCWYLGIECYQLTRLLGLNMLVPVGKPAKNGQKMFAECELIELRKDVNWHSKCALAVTRYSKRKTRNNIEQNAAQSLADICGQ